MGHSSQRISIIGTINQNKMKAAMIFEGPCDRSVVETYLETCLLPALPPGHTLVLDNASFHKGGCIESLIRAHGCDILYLPPYSPDLNPMEHHWSPLKHKIRSIITNNANSLSLLNED